jgi:type VI secretion system protein ImpE
MTAQELLRESRLGEAIEALSHELLEQPDDTRRLIFLFELLCFAGQYDRAEECLETLSQPGAAAAAGALVYRSALHAARQRETVFDALAKGEFVPLIPAARAGKLNGEPFQTIQDIDPRVGPHLEVFHAGDYLRIPFYDIEELQVEPPRMLRDLIWPQAKIAAGTGPRGKDMPVVTLPVLSPFSWRHERDVVKLGRETDWVLEGEEAVMETPYGQKMLVLDGERAVSFLEIRSLTFDRPDTGAPGAPPFRQ